ncbi:WD40/YVTN/BNR-like repeat-containing protein [Alicyclobacillus sendaiensis]|uniref:WD40/YVTN/BNR-like repeat-containing protein n=1 Tax=Alicyclobacillus sendaiensis TaxID=192387 RepID=UPI0026F432A5|nr:hypothetical protein [Alicyclobacillus sendaiensis]
MKRTVCRIALLTLLCCSLSACGARIASFTGNSHHKAAPVAMDFSIQSFDMSSSFSPIQLSAGSPGTLWVEGYQKNHFVLVRTLNLGIEWQRVRLPMNPPSYSTTASAAANGQSSYPELYVENQRYVWIAWRDIKKSFIWVEYTWNAGVSWRVVSIPVSTEASVVCQLTFINPRTGWLVVESSGASEQSDKWIYQTLNGGNTWHLVYRANSDVPRLLAGTSQHLTFCTVTNGFWLVADPILPGISLYKTTDGGVHWKRIFVSVPAQYANDDTIDVWGPTFSRNSPEDGVFAVTFYTSDVAPTMHLEVFETKDGGVTWRWVKVKNLPSEYGNYILRFFNTSIASLSLNDKIYNTTDGGRTWFLNSDLDHWMTPNSYVLDLEFSSRETMWLIINRKPSQKDANTWLLKKVFGEEGESLENANKG